MSAAVAVITTTIAHPEAQHKLEFIAGERVDSSDWSQEHFVRAC